MEIKQERRRIQGLLDAALAEENLAGEEFVTAFNSLPEGDPNLVALEQKYNEAIIKTQNLVRELENVGKRVKETETPPLTTQDPVAQAETLALNTTQRINDIGFG